MKHIFTIICLSFSLLSISQVTDTIDLSIDFNSYILFDSEDIKFNYGSSSVKVTLSENKLIVEGLEEDFPSTNLLVQTDNKIYMFILKYKSTPTTFMYNYMTEGKAPQQKQETAPILIDSTEIKKIQKTKVEKQVVTDKYKAICQPLDGQKREIMSIGYSLYDITAVVTNINVKEEYMTIRIDIINDSDLNYLMEYLEIIVTNKKKATKKNTVQEIPVNILGYSTEKRIIEGKTKLTLVFLIDKVTLSKDKKMLIRVIENNKDRRGDRDILLTIPYQYINKAKPAKS